MDKNLEMPSNYSLMSEEEMCYTEGGSYSEYSGTLKAAHQFFATMLSVTTVGAIAESCITIAVAIVGVVAAYAWYLNSRLVSCYNKVEKWLCSYSSSKRCYIGITKFWKIPTDISVSLS